MSLILREVKGSALTFGEMDGNLTYLDYSVVKVDDLTFNDFNSAGATRGVSFLLTDAKPANKMLCGYVLKLTENFITTSMIYPSIGRSYVFNFELLNRSVSQFGNRVSLYEEVEDFTISIDFASSIDPYDPYGGFSFDQSNPVDYTSGNIEVYLILKGI